jgi:hypothetical protein
VDEATGAGSAASGTVRRGGGWRALLADVLGEPGSSTSALLAALSDQPSELRGRWCDEVLDEAWQLAHADEPATAERLTLVSAPLDEAG